jgi:endonuclease/exonuclease/phosphatase family metal-dependent hydrolase
MRYTVATFNVENLIGPGKPIYDEDTPHYSPEVYEKKISWIREQLEKMNADIIGFQEVFEEQALRDCLKGTPMEDWFLAVAHPNGKSPVNALLSRFPIQEVKVVEDIPFLFEFFDEPAMAAALESEQIGIPLRKFSRSILQTAIQLKEGVVVNVWVLHLKSKRPILSVDQQKGPVSFPELASGSIRSLIRRGIEACGIRLLLSEALTPETAQPLIMLGDLNDNDTAVTNQVMLGEPPARKLCQEEKTLRWRQVLENCKDLQARRSIENFHYTYIHNGHYESLDNIFVSNHFADSNPKRSGKIIDIRLYNDHVIDSSLSMDRKPAYVSDHGQMVANMEWLESGNH